MCQSGGGYLVRKKYAALWGIPSEHFDRYAAARGPRVDRRRPLEEILVENSSFSRNHLKDGLYEAGLMRPACELCGQGQVWHGRTMGMILDHVNGVSNDNRLENLRILCPNCAATLDTHCGRKLNLAPRKCLLCGTEFRPRYSKQRYCSAWCGQRHDRSHLRGPRPETRKVERPPYAQLLAEVRQMGYCTVGRKYGVSDNAIRKWIRAYERESELADRGA